MIVPRGVVAPLALLVAIVTVTVVYDEGIGSAPSAFFGSDSNAVILGPANGAVPGRGVVPAELVGPLRALPYVETVSPEIYDITTLSGSSLFVRGVDLGAFLATEHAALTRGRAMNATGEMVAGEGAMRAFGLRLGETVYVPSSFQRSAVAERIVGAFDAPGPARDEALVTLEDGRRLTTLAESQVHLVRIVSSDPENLTALLSSVAPTFTYSDVKLSSTDVNVGDPITLTANLTNWGLAGGTKDVLVKRDGVVVAEKPVSVAPRSTTSVSLTFAILTAGDMNITINPTFHVTVREPRYRFDAPPGGGVVGRALVAHVLDATGNVAPGVRVTLGEAENVTDASGTATLTPTREGSFDLTAWNGTRVESTVKVFVALPENADKAVAAVDGIELPPDVLGVNSTPTVTLDVRNRGGARGETRANVTIDGEDAAGGGIVLSPGEAGGIAVKLPAMSEGEHVLGTVPGGPTARVRVYGGSDPRVTALLEALKNGPSGTDAAPQTLVDATTYVDQLLGNVKLAVLTISLAAGALVSLGAIAVLSRHLAERGPSVGTLKALGAAHDHVLAIAMREALALGGVASLLGVAAGLALAWALDAIGLVRAFGHAVHPVVTWAGIGAVLLASLAFVVFATRSLLRGILARPAEELLRGRILRPAESAAPTLAAALDEEARA